MHYISQRVGYEGIWKLLNIASQRDPTRLMQRVVALLMELLDKSGNHECPCCGARLSYFRPYPKPFKPNVECPKCGSHERHRLLSLYLKERTNFFSAPLQVLHFSPENCFKEHFTSSRNLRYLTSGFEARSAMIQADITRLPFQPNLFDVLLCLHVLEHVSNDNEAMKELFRVLKPGGWAIVQVPIDKTRQTTFEDPQIVSPDERERAFGQYDHVRLYGLDYRSKLSKVGFLVTTDDFVKELPRDVVDRFGLDFEEEIYVLNKLA